MTIPKKCIEITSAKKIVFKEKRSIVYFINASEISIKKVIIDNCVITEGKRCDYLLLIINSDIKEHFIELKGSDVGHAIKQLLTTIKIVSENAKSLKKAAYVISTKCPISSTTLQIVQKKVKKEFNTLLFVKKPKSEIKIS